MTKREILRQIEDAARMETHFDLRSMREFTDEWGFSNIETANRYNNQRQALERQALEMGVTAYEIEEALAKGNADAWDAYREAEGEVVHDDSYDDYDMDYYAEED
ncbi:MAG: hypothetical protein IJ909_01130 [Fibrobacter sp.]|nr:hypothetical protein [Fibrobacter sp.]